MFESLRKLRENIARVVIGKQEVTDLLLVGLLAEGHILIEDVPGVGKTLMAKALAASLDCKFRRLQFTPDLTPTDVTGFFVFDRKANEFTFRSGPVMTNILLADEINRGIPRTQSSLLEVMEERQVTVDNHTFCLPRPYMVLATQNPIELEGTFPLPEAQLDRFLLKIKVGYPTAADEERIIATHGKQSALDCLQAVAKGEDVLAWQEQCRRVHVEQDLVKYIISLIRATREHQALALGASPRACLAVYRAARAYAVIEGRDYVIPDDIKYLAGFVLGHRLILRREDRLRGLRAEKVLEDILAELPLELAQGAQKSS